MPKVSPKKGVVQLEGLRMSKDRLLRITIETRIDIYIVNFSVRASKEINFDHIQPVNSVGFTADRADEANDFYKEILERISTYDEIHALFAETKAKNMKMEQKSSKIIIQGEK